MPKYTIFGSGGWGTAIAVMLASKPDNTVRMLCRTRETAEALRRDRENKRQLPGVKFPDTLQICDDVLMARYDTFCWIMAVPTAYLRESLRRWQLRVEDWINVVSLTKGIENATFQRPSEIIAAELGTNRIAVLSGPSHAEEVARGMPTSVSVASSDLALASWVQEHLGGERLRIYTNMDLVGVELAGALKNVLGIAAGICDGLGFGDNAKAALLTRGLVEMQRFGVAHGADPATFHGLAGMGDLITTCFSKHGRNRRVGERLAKGESLETIRQEPTVAEGIFTAKSVYERCHATGMDTPIFTSVYRVLYEGKSPASAVMDLLGRPQKREGTSS